MSPKKRTPLVSIIIPSFNSEQCIRRCLNSVVNQDYPRKEIIVIDDGSTDDSVRIIEQFAKNNKSMKLIQLNHCGPNAARKAGVKEATGDYIMFVDSDDCLADGAVRLLVGKFSKYDVDVIRFNAKYQPGNKIVVPVRNMNQEKTINHDEIIRLLLTTYAFNSLWSQIYKADLIKDSKAFDLKIRLGEDLLINADVHRKTKRVLMLEDSLYYYNVTTQSISHTAERDKIINNVLDRIYVSNKMIEYATANVVDEALKEEASFAQLKMLWTVMKKLSKIVGYTKGQFLSDFATPLEKDSFSKYNSKELRSYLNSMSFKQSIIDKKAVAALTDCNFAKIWRCLKVYGVINSIIPRRKD